MAKVPTYEAGQDRPRPLIGTATATYVPVLVAEFAQIVRDNQRMLGLLEQIISLASSEAGNFPINTHVALMYAIGKVVDEVNHPPIFVDETQINRDGSYHPAGVRRAESGQTLFGFNVLVSPDVPEGELWISGESLVRLRLEVNPKGENDGNPAT